MLNNDPDPVSDLFVLQTCNQLLFDPSKSSKFSFLVEKAEALHSFRQYCIIQLNFCLKLSYFLLVRCEILLRHSPVAH